MATPSDGRRGPKEHDPRSVGLKACRLTGRSGKIAIRRFLRTFGDDLPETAVKGEEPAGIYQFVLMPPGRGSRCR